MWFSVLILPITHVVFPLFLISLLWRRDESSQFRWLVRALSTGAFLLFMFFAGRWDWLSIYLRYVLIGFWILAAVVSYRRVRSQPFFRKAGAARWRDNQDVLFELLVYGAILAYAASGRLYFEDPVRLTWPLRDGRYYVGQGGNNWLLNYHNSNRSQQYALDIHALNRLGLRAWGIYPKDLERYTVFGRTVYSPCNGEVVESVDGLPDLIPPDADRENLAGNHVVIACQGSHVLLAHLQEGSVQVAVGDMVTTGQPLARVGNSGNTSEPHLHMHAVRAGSADILDGDGMPMIFDGRFLVRNAVIRGK